MKKKVFILFSIILLVGTSCQKKQVAKQYFEQAPEIDIAKKVIDSYLKQDWDILRSCYSDTARIHKNAAWTSGPGITIDEEIEETKKFVATLISYSYEFTTWNMVVTNKGVKWVNMWGKWVGKVSEDSDDIEIAVHIAFLFIDNKIVYESGIWDNLPMYLLKESIEKKDELAI